MLKKRLITAAILIPLFILLVLKLSPHAFALMTLAFVLLGAWEWSNLMGIKGIMYRYIYITLIFICSALSIFIPTHIILCIASGGWLIAFFLVLIYPHLSQYWGKGRFARALMGLFVLIPTWRALNFIRDNDLSGTHSGPYLILFLFVLIWGADSGAYFAGKLWGKHKLAPRVSPGKTWQGLAGALLITLVIGVVGRAEHLLPSVSWSRIVLFIWIVTLFSVLGDLFESMLKRNVGIKDSGILFPGHGGLLDRIDSLTAAAPIFALAYLFLLKSV